MLKNTIRIISAAFFCVFIHFFVSNFFPFFAYLLDGDSFATLAKKLTASVTLIFQLALLLSFVFVVSVRLGQLLLFVINFIGCLYSYYYAHFGIRINDELLSSMLFFRESNDVWSSFDWQIILYLPVMMFISWQATQFVLRVFQLKPATLDSLKQISLKSCTRQLTRILSSWALLTAVVITSVLALYVSADANLTVYRERTVAEQAMPSYVVTRKSNIKKLAKVKKSQAVLQDYANLSLQYDATDSEDPLLVILVIGETLRSDRLSINGYERETTPLLSKKENLYSFKDVVSCATTTSVSLPCMLTNEPLQNWSHRFSAGDYQPKHSIVKAFTDLDFDTHFISTANKDYSVYVSENFHGADSEMLSNELRRRYIDVEDDFGDMLLVREVNADIQQPTLYVLGTMGSHRDYFSRYPRLFAEYKPDRGTSIERINNAYDNTVRYFDSVINELTDKVKDKNALLVYVSDHGESLGENGIFLHGAKVDTAPPEQRHVPMLVWMSDKYIANHPEQQANVTKWLTANREGGQVITHDFLFHSLLDCANVQSGNDSIDKQLSVCSTEGLEHQQLVDLEQAATTTTTF